MIKACSIALLALASMAASAGAQATDMQCPKHASAALMKVLYLFAIGRPETFATCIYTDGTDQSLPLQQGCNLSPIDLRHEGSPLGGMLECQEKEPNRCRITCPSQ
jgi:hypothetical protein